MCADTGLGSDVESVATRRRALPAGRTRPSRAGDDVLPAQHRYVDRHRSRVDETRTGVQDDHPIRLRDPPGLPEPAYGGHAGRAFGAHEGAFGRGEHPLLGDQVTVVDGDRRSLALADGLQDEEVAEGLGDVDPEG